MIWELTNFSCWGMITLIFWSKKFCPRSKLQESKILTFKKQLTGWCRIIWRWYLILTKVVSRTKTSSLRWAIIWVNMLWKWKSASWVKYSNSSNLCNPWLLKLIIKYALSLASSSPFLMNQTFKTQSTTCLVLSEHSPISTLTPLKSKRQCMSSFSILKKFLIKCQSGRSFIVWTKLPLLGGTRISALSSINMYSKCCYKISILTTLACGLKLLSEEAKSQIRIKSSFMLKLWSWMLKNLHRSKFRN